MQHGDVWNGGIVFVLVMVRNATGGIFPWMIAISLPFEIVLTASPVSPHHQLCRDVSPTILAVMFPTHAVHTVYVVFVDLLE